MGYRLDVRTEDGRLNFYGTKLYGYVNDEKDLASYKYLEKIGKLDPEQYYLWDYGCDNEMCLTKGEFEQFAKLYEQDMQYYITPYLRKIGHTESWTWENCSEACGDNIGDIIQYDGNKIISWG